jgi:hypothetical protein
MKTTNIYFSFNSWKMVEFIYVAANIKQRYEIIKWLTNENE